MEVNWRYVVNGTYRLQVPGGWLYRYESANSSTMCFVPDQPTKA